MGVSMLDNISYKGQKPDNARSQFDTIEEMVAFSENYLPPIYVTLCVETGKQYKYQRSNAVDPVLGKWREMEEGGSGTDTYSKTEIDNKDKAIQDSVGDITKLFSDELRDLVSAINVVYGAGADDFSYENKKVIIKLRNGGSKEINCAPIITDTSIGEFKDVAVETLADGQVLMYDLATAKWKNGTIDLAKVLEDAKKYTDDEINKSELNNAIGCDEKPTFDGTTITYKQNGETKTTDDVSKWFYYQSGVGVAQVRWISGIEYVMDLGAINLSNFLDKTTDVADTFEETPTDLSKIPNLKYISELRAEMFKVVGDKVNKSDIVDALDSDAADKPLSAHQGKALKAEIDKKLSLEQSVDDAGKVPKVGPDGKVIFSDIDGGTADKVTYENETHTDWNTVKKALDGIIAKVEYVKPEIKSFTVTPSTTVYEVGQSVSDLEFEWSYNKEVTTQSLTDVTIELADRSGSYAGPLTTSKTFKLTCGDGENTASKEIAIAFRNKIYFGGAAEPENYDSAFILGLAKNQFATTKAGSFAMTVGDGEYGYLAFPKSFGNLSTINIGGFDVEVVPCGDLAFTNASGYANTYSIYRTGRTGLGSITMVVK